MPLIFLSACSVLGSIVMTRTVRSLSIHLIRWTEWKKYSVISLWKVMWTIRLLITIPVWNWKRLLAIMWMLLKSDLWDVRCSMLSMHWNMVRYRTARNWWIVPTVFLIRIFRTVSLRQAFSMRWYIIIVALKNPSTVSAANQRVCMPCWIIWLTKSSRSANILSGRSVSKEFWIASCVCRMRMVASRVSLRMTSPL